MFNNDFKSNIFRDLAARDKDNTMDKMGTGIYQCFCTRYPGSKSEVPICDQYSKDQLVGLGLSNIVSFSIVIVNFILRTANMILIKYIGHHTESKQTTGIMTSIFVSSLFNTAILLLLANANTQQTWLFWLPFKGEYPDLTYEWYNDVGSSLIITMLTAAFMPAVEFMIQLSMRTAFRILDSGFKCRKYSTKKKTIQQYVNLYSGPEYMMHFKYAAMLNVVFVTFMYGLAVPLLFPIATIFFAVSWVVERLSLAYSYRKPPMFDDVLNKTAISSLKAAPIFMMVFGFWVFGNQQIFDNFVEGRTYKSDPVVTDHTGYQLRIDQTLPLFISSVLMVVLLLGTGILPYILIKLGLIEPYQEAEVDEGLGTYTQCLGSKVRKAWLIEEMHMRKKFGAETVNASFFDKLKYPKQEGVVTKKRIRSTPNYEITSNL